VNHRQGTILVVEDDDLVSDVILRTLEAEHFECFVVARGDEALDRIDAPGARWDVVVLDLSLPDRRGDEVLQQIRERLPKLPVVVSSGQDARVVASATLAAATVFLPKPFRGSELLMAIRRAMAQ